VMRNCSSASSNAYWRSSSRSVSIFIISRRMAVGGRSAFQTLKDQSGIFGGGSLNRPPPSPCCPLLSNRMNQNRVAQLGLEPGGLGRHDAPGVRDAQEVSDGGRMKREGHLRDAGVH